tara:strand:- start:38596 stop:38727 length:132 start_codon:yes stop_codon:yes gene_type:complete
MNHLAPFWSLRSPDMFFMPVLGFLPIFTLTSFPEGLFEVLFQF